MIGFSDSSARNGAGDFPAEHDPLVRSIAALTDDEIALMDSDDLVDVFRFAGVLRITSRRLEHVSALPAARLRRLARFIRWQCRLRSGIVATESAETVTPR